MFNPSGSMIENDSSSVWGGGGTPLNKDINWIWREDWNTEINL